MDSGSDIRHVVHEPACAKGSSSWKEVPGKFPAYKRSASVPLTFAQRTQWHNIASDDDDNDDLLTSELDYLPNV
eukprot:6117813-Karenia_brevis.AAC.1